eukprot:3665991-Pleurochrysis_carterae.AAC.2
MRLAPGRGGCIRSTYPSVPKARGGGCAWRSRVHSPSRAQGVGRGWAPMVLQRRSPAQSHRERRLVGQYTGDGLAGRKNLIMASDLYERVASIEGGAQLRT